MFGFAASIQDLSELGRAGKIASAPGRERELAEVVRVLSRLYSQSVLVVGRPGSGKTRFVHSVVPALCAQAKEDGEEGLQFLELSPSILKSRTVRVRDAILALLASFRTHPKQILLVDDIFPLIDPREDPSDPAGLLGASIRKMEVWCIGTMSEEDYALFAGLDPVTARKFKVLHLAALSEAQTVEELRKISPQLESDYRVRINEAVLRKVIRLTQEYLPGEDLPGKALAALAQASMLCRQRLDLQAQVAANMLDASVHASGNNVSSRDLRSALSKKTSVDITAAEEERWRKVFADRMKAKVVGQDAAIEQVAAAMAVIREQYQTSGCPAGVMLFGGPRGCGKAHTARVLAQRLMGSRSNLTEFTLGEGHDPRVIGRMLKSICGKEIQTPSGEPGDLDRGAALNLVLVRGIERAHPSVLGPLLRIVTHDCARELMSDTPARWKCLFIFTFNVDPRRPAPENPLWLRELLNSLVRREIVDRISAVIPFNALDAPARQTMVRRTLNELNSEMAPQGLQVLAEEEAVRLLAAQGHSDERGAAALMPLIKQLVTDPVQEMMRVQAPPRESVIDVVARNERVQVRLRDPQRPRPAQGSTPHP